MVDDIFESVVSTEKTVIVRSIVIGGCKFDCEDLYETLSAVESSDVELTYTREKIDALKTAGIIESAGSRRWLSGATLGDNGEAFIKRLGNLIYDE